MATKTVVNISPKVLTGGLCGLGVAVTEAVIAAVTPHTLAFLGPWETLALVAVPPVLGQVAAWFKREQELESKTTDTVQVASIANTHTVTSVSGAAAEPLGWVGPAPASPAPAFDQLLSDAADVAAHNVATSPQ